MTSAGLTGPPDLGLTGERTLPGIWHELDLDGPNLRHVAATYRALAPVCANLVALPIGTGSVALERSLGDAEGSLDLLVVGVSR